VEVLVGNEVVDISELLHDLLDCLRIGGEDGSSFVVNFLEVSSIDLAQLTIPVAVPIRPFHLLLLAPARISRLLQIGVQLVDRLALVDLQEFFYQVDHPLRNSP
jgi:hypothetical protein